MLIVVWFMLWKKKVSMPFESLSFIYNLNFWWNFWTSLERMNLAIAIHSHPIGLWGGLITVKFTFFFWFSVFKGLSRRFSIFALMLSHNIWTMSSPLKGSKLPRESWQITLQNYDSLWFQPTSWLWYWIKILIPITNVIVVVEAWFCVVVGQVN